MHLWVLHKLADGKGREVEIGLAHTMSEQQGTSGLIWNEGRMEYVVGPCVLNV